MSKKFILFFILILASFSLAGCQKEASNALMAAERIPIQHNGRLKPLSSFSKQTLKLVAGKERWEKKDATVFMLEILKNPFSAQSISFIRIDFEPLKEKLNLDKSRVYFSYQELSAQAETIQTLVRAAKKNRDADVRPTAIQQKAELLYNQFKTVEALSSGESLKFIPVPGRTDWLSPYEFHPPFLPDFKKIVILYGSKDSEFLAGTEDWIEKIKNGSPELSLSKINLEVFYNHWKPFEAAAVFYLFAFLLFTFVSKPWGRPAGVILMATAVVCHSFGILTRVIVLGRPPVSNMYESMIFMNWALVVFALVFYAIKKNLAALTVGSLVSAFIMIYADLLPIDSSLEVLVPVLRSNYWLSIHVMTIVSSYGAFGLAMGLGHRHLFLNKFTRFSKKAEKESADLIYRVIQLGVLLIGTGTVLGGVWANESWGRFWGWDPKETWALITFLGYLIVIHLKFAKKISDFQIALSSVLGFQLVLMTWYGVNFVLGRGLHSYGAGTGGMNWVIYFLIFEAVFLSFISVRKSSV